MALEEDNYDQLNLKQRLKAAVHHTTLKICRAQAQQRDVQLNRMVVAAISEATWKKCEQFSTDLELFAKHAKRTTITADDVKLLIRKSPKLLQHINMKHDGITAAKEPKKKRKTKSKDAPSTSNTVLDVDEGSLQHINMKHDGITAAKEPKKKRKTKSKDAPSTSNTVLDVDEGSVS